MTEPWQRQIRGLLKMGGTVTLQDVTSAVAKGEQEILNFLVNELGATISEEGLISLTPDPGETVPRGKSNQEYIDEQEDDDEDDWLDDDHPIWDGAFNGPYG